LNCQTYLKYVFDKIVRSEKRKNIGSVITECYSVIFLRYGCYKKQKKSRKYGRYSDFWI